MIICGSLLVAAVLISFLRIRIANLLDQLADSARSDLLTGLLNSRGLRGDPGGELERARMGAHRVSVLVIQLTGLREAQKSLGLRESDQMLCEFARLLDDSTRRMDAVARTGVAEFSMTLPETDEGTAFLLSEQILSRCRRAFRARNVAVSLSIGIAAFPKHGASGGTLTQAAAAAADAARMLGSDRAVVFSAELDEVLADGPGRELKEQRTHLSTVLSLAEVLELRDPRTANHSAAVGRYCELIAGELGFSAHRTQRLRLAGLLHDIGKVGIADSIWEKPGPLAPNEWDEVRRHPELAARILGSRELADIREWILCRHEQPDGHGYPRGIGGDAIPIESRILAVAESYDAMTSPRPYREPLGAEEAIAELGRYAGIQFDGAVVDTFLRALRAPRPSAASTSPDVRGRRAAGRQALARAALRRGGRGDPRLCRGRRRAIADPSRPCRRASGRLRRARRPTGVRRRRLRGCRRCGDLRSRGRPVRSGGRPLLLPLRAQASALPLASADRCRRRARDPRLARRRRQLRRRAPAARLRVRRRSTPAANP